MKTKTEKLGDRATVKGAMLQAHLAWAESRKVDVQRRLPARLSAEAQRLASGQYLVTDWVPFRLLIEIDRAIAAEVGGGPDEVYRSLGRHSAETNLSGVYKSYVVDEPHRFFERGVRLHERFQNFGKAEYERLGERAGRIRISEYYEYSPVFCASGMGYYEGVLHLMKVPGPIHVTEPLCQCAGDPACLYEFTW